MDIAYPNRVMLHQFFYLALLVFFFIGDDQVGLQVMYRLDI
jgi:hypothetical protein